MTNGYETKRTGKGNPNRPRSKNNPDGKRKDPKIDWAAYNKRRKAEGADYYAKMKDLADAAREAMGMASGARQARVSHFAVQIKGRTQTLLLGPRRAPDQVPQRH